MPVGIGTVSDSPLGAHWDSRGRKEPSLLIVFLAHPSHPTTYLKTAKMPLAKRFKLGLSSCFGGGISPPTDKGEENETASKPYDFTQHREHATWSLAVAAAAATKNRPTPEDALVPWSHTISAASDDGASEVCTFAPLCGAGRATLFLRSTLTASALATKLNKDFFEDKLVVEVRRKRYQYNG